MKKVTKLILVPVLVVSALFLAMSAVHAYTINDTTQVLVGRTDTVDDSYGFRDTLGNYNVHGINVGYASGSITLGLYTDFSGYELIENKIDIRYADLALDLNGDKIYEYGVVLSGKQGLTLGAIYLNPQWATSRSYLEKPNTVGAWEYGEFLGDTSTYVNTHITGGDTPLTNKATVTTSPGYLIEINIPIADLIWASGEVGIFWAGATCGNDIIQGSAPVPEPATMLLLGTGLIGLAGFGRKKLFKK
jgi:hypothetical protein